MVASAKRHSGERAELSADLNTAAAPLFEMGICQASALSLYHPRVRDRDDIRVLRCGVSGVILLERSDHIDVGHYQKQEHFEYWSATARADVLRRNLMDDQRRAEQFKSYFLGKRCLDVGTGAGGLLDQITPWTATIAAVEPQAGVRAALQTEGYQVYPSLETADLAALDTVTLFHVLEHMTAPIDALRQVRRRLRPGGAVVVEVPHARDFLLTHLKLEAFKNFTFWSEHLILHTRSSLEGCLRLAGFSDICIEGYQRYPLANHLHWLKAGEPGGHERHAELSEARLNTSYAELLSKLDATDTLVATARA